MKNSALLVLDVINDITHENGSYAKEGYYFQSINKNLIPNINNVIDRARTEKIPVIFVKIGYTEKYYECPSRSKLLHVAKDEGRLLLNTWATEFHADLKRTSDDIIIIKNRISPFYGTNLDLILTKLDIKTLILTGVSTEFVVLSTAREAHDRDYEVIVIEDAVVAIDDEAHKSAIRTIKKTAEIKLSNSF
jgi:nicotinamidase-related amidase